MDEVSTTDAPESIGPFSQGIVSNSMVYVSGQGPVDPQSDTIVAGDIRTQTERTLDNIAAVLRAAGCSLDDVVRAQVYVRDMSQYDAVNEVYSGYMSEPYPARTAVEVSELPIDIDVEVDVVAEQR